jgi:hypothetical protein
LVGVASPPITYQYREASVEAIRSCATSKERVTLPSDYINFLNFLF